MIEEQWKTVKNYEGLYDVSNYGEVKSLERFDNRGHHRKEKLLSPGKTRNGYLKVDLWKNGLKKPFRINRLVWQTFVGKIPPKWDVNHLDENKENNHLENLEACSHEKNCGWGNRNKKIAAAHRGKKQSPEAVARIAAALTNHPQRSKPVEAVDKVTGRIVYVFPSTAEAGRQGFCQGHVAACCRGQLKSHKGFIWRYKTC